MSHFVAFLLGAFVCGIVAHRKPQWFNKAVTLVNKIDDQVNAQISKLDEK